MSSGGTLVDVDDRGAGDRAVGVENRRRHGHDLAGEPGGRDGIGSATLRPHRVFIEIVASKAPCFCDPVGRFELTCYFVVLLIPRRLRRSEFGITLEVIGTWLIDSTPPAIAASTTPPATSP